MSQSATTVFIVDDDRAMCDSLCWLIESVGLKAKAFESAGAFLTSHDANTPGCLITDVRMPGMSGLELLARLSECGITLPVLLITGHGDVPMAVRAMKAGAFDFFEKPFKDQALIERVHQAIEHDRQFRQARERSKKHLAKLESLSPRERQVLELVIKARLNKQIAAELELSEKTVETHRSNVMKKMEASTVVDLVRMVLEYDMLPHQSPAGPDSQVTTL